MKPARTIVALTLCSLALLFIPAGRAEDTAPPKGTPLDDYIAKADSTYSWKLVKTIPGKGYTAYLLDMKSQTWREAPEVNRPVWRHWLMVVKPDQVKHDTAMLFIGGGNANKPDPDRPNDRLVYIAQNSGAVVAELGLVPFQPLIFNGDGVERVEDDIIAYCWVKHMQTGDPTWLPRLPMVKSAVRAMDAVTEMMAGEQGGKTPIKKFVVAGGSKRGWTTWLTAAVDPRVAAIVPIVIDVVNVRACSEHHYSVYGFWAQAIGDYENHKIFDWFYKPEYARLLSIVDPYSYRHRFTMPKLVLNASGDEFFPPDSSQFYFDELPGVKYLRYVPNAKHSLKDTDAVQTILAFFRAILGDGTLPKYSWQMHKDGALEVRAQTPPREVNLWQATNPRARDFRLEPEPKTLGPTYHSSPLAAREPGVYVARVPRPAEGWTAFFVELVFDSGGPAPYKFTTQVYVTPDTLPHSLEELKTKK
jgi:PhoPQ-activated pathogenicity-related protein